MIRSRSLRPWLLVPLLLVSTACGEDAQDDGPSSPKATDALGGTLTVLAAASLTDAFADIADAFEAEHDGVRVELSFDGSSRLATTIVEGVPGDVFASADEASLETVTAAGEGAGDPVVFATNVLQIVVPAGNPLDIDSLADLTASDVALSLCAEEVPCGRYAAEAFERAGLDVPPAGDQESVKGVLAQVQLGEADAGVVYVTDVLAADGVEGVDLPSDQQVRATYPATVLAGATNEEAAAAFLAFLTSDTAQRILGDHGFGSP